MIEIDGLCLDFAEQFKGLTVPERLALYRPLTMKQVLIVGDREICKTKTPSGRREYLHRMAFVYQVYDGKCMLCGFSLWLKECTVDHIETRGMNGSKHDDRVTNIWPAHGKCNGRRGSRGIIRGQACEFCGYGVVIGVKSYECFHCGCQG